MQLPAHIEEHIESMVRGIPLATLIKHFQQYSLSYRDGMSSQISLPSQMEKICYLATRMPATFGAVTAVFQECERRIGKVSSLLDFGAGPGTAFLSALELGWELKSAMLLEKSQEFIALGKQWTPSWVIWQKGDLVKLHAVPKSDVAIFSYSLGEIPEQNFKELLAKAWDATQKAIVIVEPGTPRGFKRILQAREYLIGLGGRVVAPCPCNAPCPMTNTEWCHFSIRISRSSLHRRIKHAQLGYEDEKFCYMILAKEEGSPCKERVIKTPQHVSGRIVLTLCTASGIQNKIVSKKEKDVFVFAKKTHWGMCF
ncbi:MAG: hypothetical protein KGZ39_07745 [Simkania sp.]|nr:hypothetical protein [Simkania sp.]